MGKRKFRSVFGVFLCVLVLVFRCLTAFSGPFEGFTRFLIMLLAFGVKMGTGSSSSGKARSALNGLRDKGWRGLI